ncbi:histidine acid phosphatase, partial [Ancylostoma ceylanicum]
MGLLAYSTFLSVLWIAVAQSPTSLQFVEFWFRHGERLPTHYVYFPTDPQPLIPYTEVEAGELTNRGIQEAFQRGQFIRKNYGNFLGSVYRPSQIHVWTGNDNRTVTSAQAVLAGAYKPDKAHQWSSILDWQPIAVHTDPTIDWVSTGINGVCPMYEKTFYASAQYQDILGYFDPSLIEFLENNT